MYMFNVVMNTVHVERNINRKKLWGTHEIIISLPTMLTHAKGPIACVSIVTRAGETSFSVVTSCILMAVMSAFSTFIHICSYKLGCWRKHQNRFKWICLMW